MATYQINLLDRGESVRSCQRVDLPDDDAAIDLAGSIDHAQALDVWQGQRLVAHFVPVGAEAHAHMRL